MRLSHWLGQPGSKVIVRQGAILIAIFIALVLMWSASPDDKLVMSEAEMIGHLRDRIDLLTRVIERSAREQEELNFKVEQYKYLTDTQDELIDQLNLIIEEYEKKDLTSRCTEV